MKIKKILGAIVLAAMVILPLSVSAETQTVEVKWGKCETDADGYCLINPVLIQTNNATTLKVESTMIPTNMEYVGNEENGTWGIEVIGTTIIFSSKSNTPISDAKSALGTLKFKKLGEPCNITFKCFGIENKVEPKPVTNTKTGNFLPYAVIATGLVIAGGVYFVTRKNNKFYRI